MPYRDLHVSELPERLVREMQRRERPGGRAWLEALPDTAARWMAHWDLERDGTVRHGHCGVVLPVRRGGEPLALKLTLVDAWSAHETHALRLWEGNGAARLLDADPEAGALLLERLDPDRDLRTLPIREALHVAGDLLARLHVEVGPDLGLPRFALELDDLSDEIARAHRRSDHRGESLPFDRRVSERALAWVKSQSGDGWPRAVNTDLHYENVLAGGREPWLAVDPKVVLGPVGYGLAPLLWNRTEDIDRGPGFEGAFRTLVERSGADEETARLATLARCAALASWSWTRDLADLPMNALRVVETLG